MVSYITVALFIATSVIHLALAEYDTHEVYDFSNFEYPIDNNTVKVYVTVLNSSKSIEILCPRERNGLRFNLLPNTLETIATNDIYVYATVNGVYRKININQIFVPDESSDSGLPDYRLNKARLLLANDGHTLFRRPGFDSIDVHCTAGVFINSVAASLPGCLENEQLNGSGAYTCPCYGCGKASGPLLGVVKIMLTSVPEVMHGCGSKRVPILLHEQPSSHECSYDLLDTDRIGFYCKGRVDPPDCPRVMFNALNDQLMNVPFEGNLNWQMYGDGLLLSISYDQSCNTKTFKGYCKCISEETGTTNAVINLRRQDEYVCDLGSLLMRHLSNNILGPWCDVKLYPGRKLSIILPSLNESNVYTNPVTKVAHKVVVKSALWMPHISSNNGLVRTIFNNAVTYKQVSIEPFFNNGILELESGYDPLGVLIINHLNNETRLKMGFDSFYYRNLMKICIEKGKPMDILANIKITLQQLNGYESLDEDIYHYVEDKPIASGKDPWILRHSFSPFIKAFYAGDIDVTTVRCNSTEALVPSGCNKKAFDANRTMVIPFPEGVSQRMRDPRGNGTRIVVADKASPLSLSCSCLNTDGIESSRFEVHKLRRLDVANPFLNGAPNRVVMIPHVEMISNGVASMRYGIDQIPMIDSLEAKHEFRLALGDELYLKCQPPVDYKYRQRITISSADKPFFSEAYKTILIHNESTEKEYTMLGDDPSMSQGVWFPANDESFFSVVTKGSDRYFKNRAIESTVATSGGFEIATYEKSTADMISRSVFNIRYPKSSIVISKLGESEITFNFICGKVSPGLDNADKVEKYSGRFRYINPIHREDRLMEIWGLIKITIPTTDPYVHGCGIPGDHDKLFLPDTDVLRDRAGKIIGCTVNMKRAGRAGFYCPLPYRTDPPDCRPMHMPTTRCVGSDSSALKVSKSPHLFLFTRTSRMEFPFNLLRLRPSTFECHCSTITGVRISTIRLTRI
uniref:6-Cys domain-containing protein n=1 Tax=Babesia bovis TaxID=5865 RepID=A0A0S3J439_BABBO|nr:hypothetical protein [Babesia bovis]